MAGTDDHDPELEQPDGEIPDFDAIASDEPVVLATPDDVEDLVDEATDEGDGDGAPPASTARRFGPGLALLGLAGSMWAAVAFMRCDSPSPAAPTLSVSDDEHPAPDSAPTPALEEPMGEPALADPELGEPTPAADGAVDDATPEHSDEAPPEEAGPDVPTEPEEPADWSSDAAVPKVVKYTVRHGGSIKNVANLFKIFHHEITALNPGVGLDQQLPPKSSVVVYKGKPDERSESVGFPSAGSLEGAVPMVEGPGRVLKAIPWKSWGTAKTVALLDAALRQWAKRGKVQPVLVGNMSARTGGKLQPHSTHQSGRDVDLGYLQKLPPGEEELNWREMSARNLDAAETWALLMLLAKSGQVEVFYMDRSIQKLLHEHALKSKLMSKQALTRWMEYPRATGTGRPLIQHVRGHIDHLHVRFKCQSGESRCKSRR